MDTEDRPRPIKAAADELKAWLGFATLVVGGAAGAGVNLLTDDQANALTAILAGVPGVVGALTVMLTAFGIVKRSEPLVTPMRDPRDNDGTRLVAVGERPTAGGVLR
ncbi:MAG TPA: hypothetical protein VK878_23235 [Candidatus Deferrimicrobiaceae bacterium]|nr:hypothetical protein [Candidatus Deferrimicrobiaceae bacterium]